MANPKAIIAKHTTEAEFQADIVAFAKAHGWMVYHTLDSRGSDPGFPDLVLVRAKLDGEAECIFAELKSETGKVSVAQSEWATALPNYRLWRPSMWDEIQRLLE